MGPPLNFLLLTIGVSKNRLLITPLFGFLQDNRFLLFGDDQFRSPGTTRGHLKPEPLEPEPFWNRNRREPKLVQNRNRWNRTESLVIIAKELSRTPPPPHPTPHYGPAPPSQPPSSLTANGTNKRKNSFLNRLFLNCHLCHT